MKTFASLFSGGGLADVGAVAANYQPIWGIEINPQIAEVYATNLGNHIITKSVLDVDPMQLERPDVLWASPPCQSFSQAKVNGKETDLDMAIAQRVVDFLKTLTPPVFILENVEAYKRSKSLEFIEGALYALGYFPDRQILNAVDYSVPQTRKRLILRAVRGRLATPLPPSRRRKGWHEAIADLIPGLPESQFAEWQLRQLRSRKAFTSDCLVDGKNSTRAITIRQKDQPSFTVIADWSGHLPRLKVEGVTKQCSLRAAARFQTLPDSYTLPDSSKIACTLIGNGVPCKLSQAILEAV